MMVVGSSFLSEPGIINVVALHTLDSYAKYDSIQELKGDQEWGQGCPSDRDKS